MNIRDRKQPNLAVLFLLLMSLAVIITGCSIEKPQAPSWDTNLTIPVINRVYSSTELLEKLSTDYITSDSTGNFLLRIEETLDTVSIENTLTLEDVSDSYDKQVGPIRIVTSQPVAQQVAIADYIPLVAGEVPDTGVLVQQPLGQNVTFSQVTFSSGGFIVTITNNTGFPLDSVECDLRDNRTGMSVAEYVVPGELPDGSSVVDTIPLAGKIASSQLSTATYFHTPGGFALSLAESSLDLSYSFTGDVYASSATAQTQQFSTDYQQRTKLNTDYHIENATLSDGVLDVSITNNLPLPANLHVTFPDIQTGAGPLALDVNVDAGASVHVNQNLAGSIVQPVADSISAEIVAVVGSSNGEFVTVNQSDEFRIDLDLSNVRFASARGVITPTEIEWYEDVVEVDVPSGMDQASFDDAELELRITNGSELPADLEINLRADNGVSLTLPGHVHAGTVENPQVTTLTVENLHGLLSPVPHSITVSGTATVGDGVTTVDISNADFLTAFATLTSPMHLRLDETSFEGDKEEIEVKSDVRDRVDRFNHGTFYGTITNHLPLGASVTVYLATDSTTLYTDPIVTIGPMLVNAASVNENGTVSGDVKTDNVVQLTSQQAQVFGNERVYVGLIVTSPGSNGEVIKILPEDHLDVSGYVEISARVGGEDF